MSQFYFVLFSSLICVVRDCAHIVGEGGGGSYKNVYCGIAHILGILLMKLMNSYDT